MIDRDELLNKLKYFIDPNRENTQYKLWNVNWNILKSLISNGVYPFEHKFRKFTESTAYIKIDRKRLYSYMLDLLNRDTIDILDVLYTILLANINKRIIITTYDNIYMHIFINDDDVLLYNLSNPDDGFLLYSRKDNFDKTISRNKFLLIKCSLEELSNEGLFPLYSVYIQKSHFPKKYNIFKNTNYNMILSFIYHTIKFDIMEYDAHMLLTRNHSYDDFLQDIHTIYKLYNKRIYLYNILNMLKGFNVIRDVKYELYEEKENLFQILKWDKNLYSQEIHKSFYVKEDK